MKDIELKLLSQLMKNSRRSDRDLAKAVGTSQPTITRTRQRLEKGKIIKDYTMIPDFGKLGIEILAFTFGVWVPEMLKTHPENERIEKANKFISEHPNVIFASSGRGLGMGRMIVTVHKDYADYNEFMQQAEYEWAGFLAKLESFTISLKSDAVLMPLSLRNLMEYVMKTE